MKLKQLVHLLIFGLLVSSCHKNAESASLYIPHPDDTSKQVEYFVETPSVKGPWPTIVFLHGHQEGTKPGGKDFVTWGILKKFSGRGYLAVAVSQPGYGNSTGPADYCGAFTQDAVLGVIAKLRKDGLASPNKLLIQGISRGALTAGLIAAHDPSVSGIILISGVYDLPAYVAGLKANPVRQVIVGALMSETDGSTKALDERSVLHYVNGINAATLILNGARDERTDATQALHLAEQILANGGKARTIIYSEYGHNIPVDIRNKDIDPFIDSVLGKPDSPSAISVQPN